MSVGPEGLIKRFMEVARRALEELPDGPYCTERRDEYGNPHHKLNWDAVRRIYACAIYVRPPDYSRRLIVVPGAVVSYTTDGAVSYCAVYRTIDRIWLNPLWEIHVDEWPPNDVERAKAVCLR
jgi:hypothetical protein